MDMRISLYADEDFPRIQSDLHNSREFISCATEIVAVLEKYDMRYCEVHTLLEHLLNVFYRCSDSSHSDMQIYDVRKIFEKINLEKAE
ncbi:MAG: hypothetical protein Q4D37_10030 [Oscillospiraceae bacterium]|nr:hypothetical protein [Oscillospiraceae bacterium]